MNGEITSDKNCMSVKMQMNERTNLKVMLHISLKWVQIRNKIEANSDRTPVVKRCQKRNLSLGFNSLGNVIVTTRVACILLES